MCSVEPERSSLPGTPRTSLPRASKPRTSLLRGPGMDIVNLSFVKDETRVELRHQYTADNKMKRASRRRNMNATVALLQNLAKRRSMPTQSSIEIDGRINTDIDISDDENILLHGPVQLSMSLQAQNRYAILYPDELLLTKQRSLWVYRVKQTIRITDLWIAGCVEEVSEIVHHPDRSFVIGWPTTNMVATFESIHVRQEWMDKLSERISIEKSQEQPSSVSVRIICRNSIYSISKTIIVKNSEDTLSVTKRCMEEFHIEDGTAEEFQLWVIPDNKTESPYPLIGHEYPFLIRMKYLRDIQSMQKRKSTLKNSEQESQDQYDPSSGVTFQILHKDKNKRNLVRKFSLDDSHKSPKKTSPISRFLRKASKRISRDSRLFHRDLSELWLDGTFSEPLMRMLYHLYQHGPSTSGIFRKSASFAQCREVKARLNSGRDLNLDAIPVLIIASVLKEFLRCLPNCLLICALYAEWMNIASVQESEERNVIILSLFHQLPVCNQTLLLYIICILLHISENVSENQMNLYNLSVCFSHCLLWQDKGQSATVGIATPSELEESCKLNILVHHILDGACQIFGSQVRRMFEPDNSELLDEGEMVIAMTSRSASNDMNSRDVPENEQVEELERDLCQVEELERDLCQGSEPDTSPDISRGRQGPQSVTSASYDSGLTASNPQLFDEPHVGNGTEPFSNEKAKKQEDIRSPEYSRTGGRGTITSANNESDYNDELMQDGYHHEDFKFSSLSAPNTPRPGNADHKSELGTVPRFTVSNVEPTFTDNNFKTSRRALLIEEKRTYTWQADSYRNKLSDTNSPGRPKLLQIREYSITDEAPASKENERNAISCSSMYDSPHNDTLDADISEVQMPDWIGSMDSVFDIDWDEVLTDSQSPTLQTDMNMMSTVRVGFESRSSTEDVKDLSTMQDMTPGLKSITDCRIDSNKKISVQHVSFASSTEIVESDNELSDSISGESAMKHQRDDLVEGGGFEKKGEQSTSCIDPLADSFSSEIQNQEDSIDHTQEAFSSNLSQILSTPEAVSNRDLLSDVIQDGDITCRSSIASHCESPELSSCKPTEESSFEASIPAKNVVEFRRGKNKSETVREFGKLQENILKSSLSLRENRSPIQEHRVALRSQSDATTARRKRKSLRKTPATLIDAKIQNQPDLVLERSLIDSAAGSHCDEKYVVVKTKSKPRKNKSKSSDSSYFAITSTPIKQMHDHKPDSDLKAFAVIGSEIPDGPHSSGRFENKSSSNTKRSNSDRSHRQLNISNLPISQSDFGDMPQKANSIGPLSELSRSKSDSSKVGFQLVKCKRVGAEKENNEQVFALLRRPNDLIREDDNIIKNSKEYTEVDCKLSEDRKNNSECEAILKDRDIKRKEIAKISLHLDDHTEPTERYYTSTPVVRRSKTYSRGKNASLSCNFPSTSPIPLINYPIYYVTQCIAKKPTLSQPSSPRQKCKSNYERSSTNNAVVRRAQPLSSARGISAVYNVVPTMVACGRSLQQRGENENGHQRTSKNVTHSYTFHCERSPQQKQGIFGEGNAVVYNRRGLTPNFEIEGRQFGINALGHSRKQSNSPARARIGYDYEFYSDSSADSILSDDQIYDNFQLRDKYWTNFACSCQYCTTPKRSNESNFLPGRYGFESPLNQPQPNRHFGDTPYYAGHNNHHLPLHNSSENHYAKKTADLAHHKTDNSYTFKYTRDQDNRVRDVPSLKPSYHSYSPKTSRPRVSPTKWSSSRDTGKQECNDSFLLLPIKPFRNKNNVIK